MKLWKHIRKRRAMECIGSRRLYRKLLAASQLKPGDLIHTCEGINAPVQSIEPEIWEIGKKGFVVRDFEVTDIYGANCSVQHCCTLPLPSKKKVEENFLRWRTDEGRKHATEWGMCWVSQVADALAQGEELFDQHGAPLARYLEIRELARSQNMSR